MLFDDTQPSCATLEQVADIALCVTEMAAGLRMIEKAMRLEMRIVRRMARDERP